MTTIDPTSPRLSVGTPLKRQRRWALESAAPILAGLLWLRLAGALGPLGFLIAVVPGCLLLAAGVSLLLYPGDLRIPQFAAIGGVLGFLLSLPMLIILGFGEGLVLMLLSVASFLAAGWFSIEQDPCVDDVPPGELNLGLAAQVAVDEAILATIAVRSALVDDPERVLLEVHQARQLFQSRGWLASPESYHVLPPSLTEPRLAPMRIGNLAFEHLSFASEYEVEADEPGAVRWSSYQANRTAHAWVFRHADRPRPWLVCIHGYEMGIARLDVLAFRAAELHHRYGLNLCLPTLPLHGLRRRGRSSGEGFLAGEFLDTVHAEAQAMWDIRRLLSWIRPQAGGPIGVYGLSLGGYNASLLASLEGDLACVIAGIPAVDFVRLTWRHGPTTQIRYAERNGLVHDEVSEIFQVVSPLALRPKVAKSHRYIFAGIADRLVPADQPRDLWEHWDRPRIEWYQGAHVTFRAHEQINRFRLDSLRESGLIA